MLGQKRGALLSEHSFLTAAFEPFALVIAAERGQEAAEARWPGPVSGRDRGVTLPELRGGHRARPDCCGRWLRGPGYAGAPGLGRGARVRRASHGADSGSLPRGAFLGPRPPTLVGGAGPWTAPSWKHWLNRQRSRLLPGAASRLAAQWLRRLGAAVWGWGAGRGDRKSSQLSPLLSRVKARPHSWGRCRDSDSAEPAGTRLARRQLSGRSLPSSSRGSRRPQGQEVT